MVGVTGRRGKRQRDTETQKVRATETEKIRDRQRQSETERDTEKTRDQRIPCDPIQRQSTERETHREKERYKEAPREAERERRNRWGRGEGRRREKKSREKKVRESLALWGLGWGAKVPNRLRPGKRGRGASGFRIKRGALGPSCSRSSPAMPSSSDAVPDPEAPRPPAPPRHACHLLPWALSAALLLLASVCAFCAVRAWVLTQCPASPGPNPSPSSRLPEVPELPPDARAGLRDSPQVRCAPAWFPGGDPYPALGLLLHPHPQRDPFYTPGRRSVPLGLLKASVLYPGLRGYSFSSPPPV